MRRLFFTGALAWLWLAPAAAQTPDGWITISEPGEWSDERVLAVGGGVRIRVAGQTFHPLGIESVTVGQTAAQTTRDANGIVSFEAVFVTSAGMRQVTIVSRAAGGQTITKTFRLDVPDAPAAAPAPSGGGQPAARPAARSATPNAVRLNPGSAAIRSIFIPGLGQFYTKRPVVGVLFRGAAAGALGVGVGSTETTVRCRAPLQNNECPSGQTADEVKRKHMLVPGLGGFLAIGVISALEARSAASRANREAGFTLGPVRVPLEIDRQLDGVVEVALFRAHVP
jgi:hypothetical protein